ncbi:ester cyclase [Micromonospora sp. WMMD882]|uniref:ester cyclase n=1 Tax=Micromonospora sp. WMMD882 TaxID=3015151 RepID=UPI00248BFB3D|nr:ester cyclase [Micromonospora sp. WMMD882]WBB77313.1 ester cyclase [Micromonospora sp. WMMD882]
MDRATITELVGHVLAAFNERDLSHLDRCIAPDYQHPNPARARGRQGMRDAVADWLAAVEDTRLELDDLLVDGNRVTARMTFSGRQVGEVLGIPASGRTFSISVLDIFVVRDDMLVAHWDLMDRYALQQQLSAATV